MRAMTIQTACSLVVMTLGAQAHAETVVPMKGQTPEQIQSDTATCKTQAKSAYDQALAAANQLRPHRPQLPRSRPADARVALPRAPSLVQQLPRCGATNTRTMTRSTATSRRNIGRKRRRKPRLQVRSSAARGSGVTAASKRKLRSSKSSNSRPQPSSQQTPLRSRLSRPALAAEATRSVPKLSYATGTGIQPHFR